MRKLSARELHRDIESSEIIDDGFIYNGYKEVTVDNVQLSFCENSNDALKRELEFRKGLVIGEPKASKIFSVQQLKSMGIIGLYRK